VRVASSHRGTRRKEQRGVARLVVLRSDDHRNAEHRGLDQRVQAGPVESAPDVGDPSERVQLRQHARPVHEHHIGAVRVRRVQPGDGHPRLRGPRGDPLEVPRAHLVRRDDEPRIRNG